MVAAFHVREVLLQFVRHCSQLFGQRSFNLLDPFSLGLQQLLRTLTLLFERAGESHAPLGGVSSGGEVVFHVDPVQAQPGSAKWKHQRAGNQIAKGLIAAGRCCA